MRSAFWWAQEISCTHQKQHFYWNSCITLNLEAVHSEPILDLSSCT